MHRYLYEPDGFRGMYQMMEMLGILFVVIAVGYAIFFVLAVCCLAGSWGTVHLARRDGRPGRKLTLLDDCAPLLAPMCMIPTIFVILFITAIVTAPVRTDIELK